MKVMTPKFRVSYPSVFKAKKNDLNGMDEYSLVALFEKGADMSQMQKACEIAAEEKWGKDKKKWPPNMRKPFRNQGEKKKVDEATGKEYLPEPLVDGAVYMNLKSKQRPQIVDQNVTPIIDESDFYPGCFARATVNFYAYDQKGNKGVGVGLINLQKVADGESLSSRTKAEDDFQPIENAATAEDLFK